MQTVLTRSARKASEFIRRGQLVAFPTETVYGLGADLFNKAAVAKIFTAKGRPSDNPLIAHVSSLEQLGLLASRIPPGAERLIQAFFPGPLTVVLPKTEQVPLQATAGLPTIGIRMPRHPKAQAFLSRCSTPIVAPSANLSGRPSPTRWQDVRTDLDGRIACILQGDQTRVGLESTVVDCSGSRPLILRAGAISLEQLREILPDIRLAGKSAPEISKSPGMRYRHYSPHAKLVIVEAGSVPKPLTSAAYIGLDSLEGLQDFKKVLLCSSVDDYARKLFLFFRECDAAHIAEIYCQAVPETDLGLALMDRLRRAAQA
ncbi:MAG: L-threonylcarbamoyladenylate synthase [Acidobacteriota bacterium]